MLMLGVKKVKSEDDGINRAIETLDHLLWHAVLEINGYAQTVSFVQSGNTATVVYNDFSHRTHHIGEVLTLVNQMIYDKDLIIKKIRRHDTYENMRSDCSKGRYEDWLKKIMEFQNKSWSDKFRVEFVKIGNRISAPCCGKHLRTTSDLRGFVVIWTASNSMLDGQWAFKFEVTKR